MTTWRVCLYYKYIKLKILFIYLLSYDIYNLEYFNTVDFLNE